MRQEISTVALMAGLPERLVTYGARLEPFLLSLKRMHPTSLLSFVQGDSLSVEIEDTDLLFIDTKHTAEQLSSELSKHASKVRRWIVMHDTQIYGEHGEGGGPGLLVALRQFMQNNPEWSVFYHAQNNHGLTVITRDPEDKPKLPSKLTMANNFAKAVAEHVMDGIKDVDHDTLEQRLAICTMCDQRNGNRCAVCGCPADSKARWRSEYCPLGKWPVVEELTLAQ